MKYIYLLLLLGSIFFPIILSFDKRVSFFKYWKAAILASILPATLFILWDIRFTEQGVWGFNPDYILGIHLFSLPLEEILFFFAVPFSCIFIYACVEHYFHPKSSKKWQMTFEYVLGVFLAYLMMTYHDQAYTFTVSVFAFFALIWNRAVGLSEHFNGYLLAYLICLIPFGIVNGILTDLPVVWYNDEENLGIRVLSIPIEDSLYTFALLMMNFSMFDFFRTRLARA